MIKNISSFDEVELTKEKTLIICDIDETILYYPGIENKCNEMLKDLKNIFTEKEYKRELNEIKLVYRSFVRPEATDLDGFISLKNKLKDMDGKIILLTARNIEGDKFTRNQINQLFGEKDDIEIHYTNNKEISKGQYIKKYINLIDWNEVIFIDDLDYFINSVIELNYNIKCYKFVLKSCSEINIYNKTT
jgi:hypothetical protein